MKEEETIPDYFDTMVNLQTDLHNNSHIILELQLNITIISGLPTEAKMSVLYSAGQGQECTRHPWRLSCGGCGHEQSVGSAAHGCSW